MPAQCCRRWIFQYRQHSRLGITALTERLVLIQSFYVCICSQGPCEVRTHRLPRSTLDEKLTKHVTNDPKNLEYRQVAADAAA